MWSKKKYRGFELSNQIFEQKSSGTFYHNDNPSAFEHAWRLKNHHKHLSMHRLKYLGTDTGDGDGWL